VWLARDLARSRPYHPVRPFAIFETFCADVSAFRLEEDCAMLFYFTPSRRGDGCDLDEEGVNWGHPRCAQGDARRPVRTEPLPTTLSVALCLELPPLGCQRASSKDPIASDPCGFLIWRPFRGSGINAERYFSGIVRL
jgi:hypothetical protein